MSLSQAQSIASANSPYAPSLAVANGNLVAVWLDSYKQGLDLAVIGLDDLSCSAAQWVAGESLTGSRPSVVVWNGNFYVMYNGSVEDSSMYWWFTDLATFPQEGNSVNSLFNVNLSCVGNPNAFTYTHMAPDGSTVSNLVTVLNSNESTNTVQYFGFQANWLTANPPTMLAFRSSIPLPITAGLQASMVATNNNVWCLVYGDEENNLYSLSCFDQNWPIAELVPIPTPNASWLSAPVITVAAAAGLCVAWASSNGCFYSTGIVSPSGPGIIWAEPTQITNLPENVQDLTITTAQSGQMYLGYQLSSGAIGIAPLGSFSLAL